MKYLILQYPYDFIEIAICQNGTILSHLQESKLTSVSLTIPHIESLLQKENISLQDIAFIGVNTGPGPYNTLRSLITTANGIHFAKQIPLVNLNAIDLLLHEQPNNSLVMLNAFANHVFYGFKTTASKEQGYCSIDSLIYKINQQSELLSICGNAVAIHQKTLINKASEKIAIIENFPLFNSIETLAEEAYKNYTHKKTAPSYLMPQYLKSPAIKK